MAEALPKPQEWFSIIEGETLEQGDILPACPLFRPRNDLTFPYHHDPDKNVIEHATQPVVVMSQSCDIKPGQKQNAADTYCLLCSVKTLLSTPYSSDPYGQNQLARHEVHHLHLLEDFPCEPWPDEKLVVSFRDVWSLPLPFLMRFAAHVGRRARLNSPYREGLSQRFGSYYSRVGLPKDPDWVALPEKKEMSARRFLQALGPEERRKFLSSYSEELGQATPPSEDASPNDTVMNRIRRAIEALLGRN